jgi:hypothetical protein
VFLTHRGRSGIRRLDDDELVALLLTRLHALDERGFRVGAPVSTLTNSNFLVVGMLRPPRNPWSPRAARNFRMAERASISGAR